MKIFFTLFLITILDGTRYVKAEEVLRVVTENWRPYSYEENKVVKGRTTEIVRKVLERANISYKIKVYPWARAYKIASEEKNVLIYAIARTPERENNFKWVRPITTPDNIYLYKLAERKDIIINTLDDARKYQIGVIRRSMYHQFLTKHGFTNNLQIVAMQGVNHKKLLVKRIDLWAEGENNLHAEIKGKIPNDSFDRFEKAFLLFSHAYYMAFSKSTPDEIVDKVKNAFDQLKKEEAIKF